MSPTLSASASDLAEGPRGLRWRTVLGLVVLLLAPGGVSGDPRRLEIPKDPWEPLFFGSINQVATSVGLTALRRETPHGDDVEARVWVGFGLVPLKGYILARRSGRWAGETVEYRVDSRQHVRVPAPRARDWARLWDQLVARGLLTIRDESERPPGTAYTDGTSYVVELSDRQRYRTYMVLQPDLRRSPEASGMLAIDELLWKAMRDLD